MALQDGFKILDVQVIDGGGGFGHNVTYQITARDRVGQGSGFAAKVKSVNGAIPDSISITNNGKNYSSGSWEGSLSGTGSPAIKGNFTTISITTSGGDAAGSGSILVPVIGMDSSISINDINVERGFSGTTANSDIHDLYNDFASVGGLTDGGAATDVFDATETWNKPNFDWYNGGPVSGANDQDNVIRFDEFYGATYDSYGGRGCFGVGSTITLGDGSTRLIEDINIGDEIKTVNISGVPLDFDAEDTWKQWIGVPDSTTLNFTTGSVFDVYYDFYDNYYLINNDLKATWEHPFFVLRNGNYSFKKTNELRTGDELMTSLNEFITIFSIEYKEESLETVNLNVEPYDVYFANGLLVHNVHDKDA